MTKQAIIALVLRLLGVYLIAMRIPNIGLIIRPPGRENVVFYPSLVQLLLVFAVGLVLILASRPLARWLTPVSDDSKVDSSMSLTDVQAVAFSVVGVFIFAQATHGISRILLDVRRASSWQLGSLVQMVFGLVLFFQSRGLANFWQRIQRTQPMAEPGA